MSLCFNILTCSKKREFLQYFCAPFQLLITITRYKIVESHEIKAAVLLPKGLKPGIHPVILNTHGGFLTYAHALFAPFFSPWALKLALENNAIVVSGDYRLLPSANGVADVLDDLEDFWKWTHSDLAGLLERRGDGHSLDLSRVLLTGQSAGGYTSMQLALSHPDEISAVAVAYPFVNPKDHIMTDGPAPGEPTVLRFPAADIPSKQEILAWVDDAKKTITTRAGFERTLLSVGAAQHGLFYDHIFDSSSLNRPDFIPTERLRAGARLPKNM